MKTRNLIASLLFVIALCSFSFGQTSLTQTTLAAAQGIGPVSLAGGSQANLQTIVSLTSATGVQAAYLGTQPITYVYVDQELEGIVSLVTGQTTIFNVLRALSGTKAAYHASGAMVLIGTVTPQFGGNAGSGGFQQTDASVGGVCTGAVYTPWVNVVTAAQWLCSSLTGTWVPGFNNPLATVGGSFLQPTAAVASATTILPTGPLFHLTGTTAFATITLPVGFAHGCITIIQDGAAETWTAAGNIISASTSTQTVGEIVTMCYDPVTAKFYPSHN